MRVAVRIGEERHMVDPPGPVRIGGVGCEIRVDDPGVEGVLATISYRNGEWMFQRADGGERTPTRIDRLMTLHLGRPGSSIAVELVPVRSVAPPPPTTAKGSPAASQRRTRKRRPAPPPPATPIRLVVNAPPPPVPLPEPGHVLVVGRGNHADVSVSDLRLPIEHVRIARLPDGSAELVVVAGPDAFVNGQRVRRTRLEEGDRVDVGRETFAVQAGQITSLAGERLDLEARNLSVILPQKVLLDDVSLDMAASSLVAIVGPSGSGKSTLLNALSGVAPATAGSVRYGTIDVYGARELMSRRLGWVPQVDIVHPELVVRQELHYAAELRFASDVSSGERDQRIQEVLAELALSERADLRISKLSGGQRKRVSVGVELLTKPSLLCLDEPTSGLDPGNEEQLMQLLRDLAADGRIVIVVTHAPQSLDLCDRVAFLAKGGQLAYYGTPSDAMPYFEELCGAKDLPDVFTALDRDEGVDWKERFAESPGYQRYVETPLGDTDVRPQEETAAAGSLWHQFSALTRRNIAVLMGDRKTVLLLILQAPILGFLFLLALNHDAFDLTGLENNATLFSKQGLEADKTLWLLAVGAGWIGVFTTIREMVKELPYHRRERLIGIRALAVTLSKAALFGGIASVLSLTFAAIAFSRQHLPPIPPKSLLINGSDMPVPPGFWASHGVLLPDQRWEILLAVVLVALVAAAIGLLLSALSGSSDRAMILLLIFITVQVTLSIPFGDSPLVERFKTITSSEWGKSAMAATVDLNLFPFPERDKGIKDEFDRLDPADPLVWFKVKEAFERHAEPRWKHTLRAWGFDVLILCLMAAASILLTPIIFGRAARKP